MSRLAKIHSIEQNEPASTTVIQAIAEYHDIDPTDLTQPLYDVIDPDALDDLVNNATMNPDASEFSIEFAYHGCWVDVSNDGSVEITPNPAE